MLGALCLLGSTTMKSLQVTFEFLHWITTLQRVVVHPHVSGLLNLFLFFHGREFHHQALIRQFKIDCHGKLV